MRYNLRKRLRKFRITRYYLYKSLKDWRNNVDYLNCFYYAALHELDVLNRVINLVKGRTTELTLSREDWQYIKDIGNSKQIKFGKHEYKF